VPDAARIVAEPVQLQQVILNLCSNVDAFGRPKDGFERYRTALKRALNPPH
jgi:hypothetical protein